MWSFKVALYVPMFNALVGEKVIDITCILVFSNEVFMIEQLKRKVHLVRIRSNFQFF